MHFIAIRIRNSDGNVDESCSSARRLKTQHRIFSILENQRVFYDDVEHGTTARASEDSTECFAVRFAFDHRTEDGMVVVKVRKGIFSNEELRVVGVVQRLRVGQDAPRIVLEIEIVLIVKVSEA